MLPSVTIKNYIEIITMAWLIFVLIEVKKRNISFSLKM